MWVCHVTIHWFIKASPINCKQSPNQGVLPIHRDLTYTIHVHVHIHIHLHIHIHIHRHIHTTKKYIYIHVHTCTYIYRHIHLCIHVHVCILYILYIYTHIRDSLVKSPQWEPSIPQQLNTNVIRGACETCTTSCKRGQLLWIRWQVLKHCKELSIRLYPYIYIWLYMYTYPKSGMGISVFIPMLCFFEVRQYGVLHQAAFHGDIEVLRQLLEDYKANVKLLTKAEKCDAMWGHQWITTQYIMITMIYLLHKIPRLSFLVPSVFRCSQGMRRSQNVWINLPKALENLNRAIFHSAKRSCIEDGKTALQIAESAGQEAAIKYLEAGHKRCTSHCATMNEFPLLLATHECNKVQTSGWAMGRITTKQSSKANQRMLVVKHHSW